MTHFRLTIAIVLALVVVAAGILWYQTRSTNTNTTLADPFVGETESLDNLDLAINQFEADSAVIAQLNQTLDTVSSDDVAAAVTTDELASDESALDAFATQVTTQTADDQDVTSSFDILNEIRN